MVQEVGIKTFRMFTVLSNMLMAVVVGLCIPFSVDGIRNKNYHLPRWIVNLSYISVIGVTLTFCISLFILSPQIGFIRIIIKEGNIFLHTLVPLASIGSFVFVNDYHNIKFKTSFYTLIPVLVYAMVYLIAVIIIGEENGGWRDHYYFEQLMPWPFILIIIFIVTYGLSLLIRWGHNFRHTIDKHLTEHFYQQSDKYSLPTIEEVIIKMAKERKKLDAMGDVIVPRRIILMLNKKYNSNKTLEELCNLYINEYLKR